MLLDLLKFGGKAPKITDPRMLPDSKSQTAKNVRFDHGGVLPVSLNSVVNTPANAGPLKSIFLYLTHWLAWNSDVDAVLTPIANDAFKRVYYTEGGVLKATANNLYNVGGTSYPMQSYNPAPPPPSTVITAENTTDPYDYTQSYTQGQKVWQDADRSFYYATTAVGAYTIPAYDSSAKYGLKAVVDYGGPSNYTKYVCTIEITTPEAWNPAHWELIIVPRGGTTPFPVIISPFILAYLTETGLFQLVSPTQYVSVNYVFTLVSSYGDEGPPSLASRYFDHTYIPSPGQIGNIAYMLDGSTPIPLTIVGGVSPDASCKVNTIRIYRLNQDANTNEQYQFLMNVPLYEATKTYPLFATCYREGGNLYTCTTAVTVPEAWNAAKWTEGVIDAVPPASLGEVLQSLLWDAAPEGITGLKSLPNAVLAGYVGNTLCFSVPSFPHAWPLSWQKTTERPIMGLGNYGLSTIVLTEGEAYTVTSNGEPSASSMESQKESFGCLSKRSVVDLSGTLVYASTEGLTAITPGKSQTMTGNVFTADQWRKLYNPSTISGFAWEGQYVGFYDNGTGGSGFIYNPASNDFSDLDFFATAGYRDPKSGNLYLVVAGSIVSFSTAVGMMTPDYKGKRNVYRPASFAAVKVMATAYPVTVDIVYPSSPFFPIAATVTVTVDSSALKRIPPVMSDSCELRVYGFSGEVSGVFVAETIEEMPQ